MTASATHATLATFRIDPTREEEQRVALERSIVPGVQQFPGFVSGHWTVDREAAESLVLLTYEFRDAAEMMSENIIGNTENQRAAGLELVGDGTLEVAATATSN
jgi:quinol monooxygenase YgiN